LSSDSHSRADGATGCLLIPLQTFSPPVVASTEGVPTKTAAISIIDRSPARRSMPPARMHCRYWSVGAARPRRGLRRDCTRADSRVFFVVHVSVRATVVRQEDDVALGAAPSVGNQRTRTRKGVVR